MNQLNNLTGSDTERKLSFWVYADPISDTPIRLSQDQYNYLLLGLSLNNFPVNSNRNFVENKLGSASRISINDERVEDDEINIEILRLTELQNDQIYHLKKIQHELRECTEEEVKLKSEFENVRRTIENLVIKHRASSSCWKCLIA